MNPSVLHLVISLAPGGLERLVVDWTNARNRRLPGSTRIICLDNPGAMAAQVERGEKRTSNIEHSTLNIEQMGAEAPDGSQLNVECSMFNVQRSNSPPDVKCSSVVSCVGAHRSRFPWDHAAVREVVKLLSCQVAELLGNGPNGQSLTTEQPNNLTTGRDSATTEQPNNLTTGRDSATTEQPNNLTINNRLPPVVLHAHNLAAWQYAVLAKVYWRRIRTSNIEHSTLNIERGGAKAPDCSQLNVECSMFNVQRSNSLPPLRLIYTQHGANVHNTGFRDRIRARVLACFTDEIVAVSDATAEVMAKTMWLPRQRIKVVVNGVAVGKSANQSEAPVVTAVSAVQSPVGREDAAGTAATTEERLLGPKVSSEVRGRLGIPNDAFVLGSVGRLAHVKGCDRLIAAFAALKQQLLSCQVAQLLGESPSGEAELLSCQVAELLGNGPNGQALTTQQHNNSTTLSPGQPNNPTTYLLLTGDGPERANLERQARDLGIADRVIFTGYQADPAPYLAAMDLFIVPSRSEGVSVALLEAMAAGVPVAVTDVGANREVVEDGRCGVILPDDEMKWPAAITALITDQATATQRTQAARQRVHIHYSLEATLDGYERLYLGKEGISPLICTNSH